MHEKFPDFRPMGLVGRRGEIELHRANDLLRATGDENAAASCPNRRQNLIVPKRFRVIA